MARLPRLTVPGELHLILQASRTGQAAIADEADAAAYVQLFPQATAAAGVALHAYGLYPHEVRLLVTPQTSNSLGVLMQWIGRRYVRAFNDRHHSRGSPWNGRFRSTVVEASRWGLSCLRFVEGRAIDESEQPMASSRQHHFHHVLDSVVTQHTVFWQLGNTPFEREVAYRRLCLESLTATDRTEILHNARFGWALGSHEFTEAITQKTHRRTLRRLAGRPPKTKAAL